MSNLNAYRGERQGIRVMDEGQYRPLSHEDRICRSSCLKEIHLDEHMKHKREQKVAVWLLKARGIESHADNGEGNGGGGV